MSNPKPATSRDSDETASLFAVGELVALRSNPATIFPVLEVISGEREFRYRVFHNQTKATYYESQLQPTIDAADSLLALSVQELRVALTSHQILSPSTTSLLSLHSGRVKFVPYQYRPVLRLIRSDRPRLLIADEVGVGKTIEAGFIIKELRARMDLCSVLIICPKALVAERKWSLEMKRFDEQFTALDGQLLKHCLRETGLEGQWPEQYANSILPFSLFDSDLVFGNSRGGSDKRTGLLNLDPPPKFDLVIVDEAHHIRNSETFLHQGVRFFCDNAHAVIFLSATPVQLGKGDLYTLLNVLRPDLIIDPTSFEQMTAPNVHINEAIQVARKASIGWETVALAALREAANTSWGSLFLQGAPNFDQVCELLCKGTASDGERLRALRLIEELYTFSGLINRTRRRDIGEFTVRKPETLTVPFTPQQQDLHDSLLDVIARIFKFSHGQQNVGFMMTTIRRQAASCLYGLAPLLEDILNGKIDHLEETEQDYENETVLDFIDTIRKDISDVLAQARKLDDRDPKVLAFIKVVSDKSKRPNNKALVFTTFRHTLAYLGRHVAQSGVRSAIIHGSVPDDERSELRRRFALPKDDPEAVDVLLSSEVGCEGLDFQFCDLLINYDLPWNPMRIEQRIGRIDRYGQKSESIAIVNFLTPGTVDADIYERCLWRIGVFQHAIGGNEEILGEITRELRDIAESFTLTVAERESRLRQLSDNGIRQIQEEQELETKQAELFGLNIPNQTWRDEVEAAESAWLSPGALQECITTYLKIRLGAESDHLVGEKALKTLRVSHAARTALLDDFRQLPKSTDPLSRDWEKWLAGSQPSLAVTFDQQVAVDNARAVYLWALHPLVRQAAHRLQLQQPAYVSIRATSSCLKPASYRFALYRWKKHGVKSDEELVPIASDPKVEEALLDLFLEAKDLEPIGQPSRSAFDDLDDRHHQKWQVAQQLHLADNRTSVEHRIHSLTISHRARRDAIMDHIRRAGNERIAVMKQSELARANADFDRRMRDLQQQTTSADIHASAVLFGDLLITVSAIK